MDIVVIAAVSDNNVIGKDGKLPWHISEDLKRFKELTTGYPVIMGRKTFESIGKPLEQRKNVIITHNKKYKVKDAVVVHSFIDAMKECRGYDKIFVIGGQSIFEDAVPAADVLEITEVHKKVDGDAFFPEIEKKEWKEVSRTDKKEFSFVTYNKKK